MESKKEQFEAYERVRRSGKVSMMNVRAIAEEAGLTEDEVYAVMEDWAILAERYPEVAHTGGPVPSSS